MDDAEALDGGAVGDRLVVDQHVADADEDPAGLHRVPHEAAVDCAFLDEFATLARREGAEDGDLADLPGLFERAADADRALAAEGEEALEVRIGGDQVEGGLAAVVDALGDAVTVADRRHVGILLLEIGDRGVGPCIVKGHGQRADIDGVLALAAHRLGQHLGMGFAEALGRGHLEVPVDVLLGRQLVGHHLDARGTRLLEHRLDGVGVVRHHADDVDALGDQVLDCANLERRVGARRADHDRIDAKRRALAGDAGFHGVEPRDAADLDDDAHGRLVLCRDAADESAPR